MIYALYGSAYSTSRRPADGASLSIIGLRRQRVGDKIAIAERNG